MNLTIDVEAIYEAGSSPSLETLDLSNEKILFAIVVGLGNGIYDEMRVTGHSREALVYFIRLLQAGGYKQDAACGVTGRKLYRDGDACFPGDSPFVFLAPTTVSGERIDFAALEAEIQQRATELEEE